MLLHFGWWRAERLGIAILLNLSGSHEDGIEFALARHPLGARA